MTNSKFIIGDARKVISRLPENSVDFVCTSPPFFSLRSYLPEEHPDKWCEIGTEQEVGTFIDTLLDVVEECDRVLAPHGSIAFELGDTYAGSGGAGGDYSKDGFRSGEPKFVGSRLKESGPLDKSLCLIPELFRLSLSYGFNPLTNRQTPKWRLRNVIRWCKANPPVGRLGDKFRPSTTDIAIACKGKDRYFDLDSVRTPHSRPPEKMAGNAGAPRSPNSKGNSRPTIGNPNGAPPLDYWKIASEPYKGSHYAVWPTALLEKPIKTMCPFRVCLTCGKPSSRVMDGKKATESWTDCGHNNFRKGRVLDPFVGSGTTLVVANKYGRDAIGIDIDERNAELAKERVGALFLEIIDMRKEVRDGIL